MIIGEMVFKEVIRLNEVTGVGPNTVLLVSLKKEGIKTQVQREDSLKRQGEDHHLQAKGRICRNQPYRPLDLWPPASGTVRS